MSKRREARGPSQRQLRVGEEIRHLLAQVLERGELRDPDLVDVAITVTEVRITPDLKHASIYVMPLGGEDSEKAVAALGRARSFLRHQVARELTLKYIPDLHFKLDETFDEASHINLLLKDPRVAQDLGPNIVNALDKEEDGA
jgi:ribosome-binding factor A